MKKPKLTSSERLEIEILLSKNYSYRAIARSLCRSPNSISYEVEKNGGIFGYHAKRAQQYARTRKKNTRRAWSKIEGNSELRAYVIKGLEDHWNPDEIAGRMKLEKKPWYASKTAMYEWLRSIYGQRYCVYLYTRRYAKKKRVEKMKRDMIPDRVSIHQRFLGADHRTRYGHWEYDTIVSRKGCTGGVSVGVERKSRFVVATLVKSMSTFEHMKVIRVHIDTHKTLSGTFDNGIENKAHRSLGIPTFFCDTYNSGQKGSVENVNKMIRRYVPKGTNFREVSQRLIDHAVFLINNKPRKILGYKKALEVARGYGIIKNKYAGVLIGG